MKSAGQIHNLYKTKVVVQVSEVSSDTAEQLKAAGMKLPVIVKPAAACGVAAAHSMAIVLRAAGFAGLRVPLPASVQEYIDHGARLHKVYVLGAQVRWHDLCAGTLPWVTTSRDMHVVLQCLGSCDKHVV
jgi:hypothetical protein